MPIGNKDPILRAIPGQPYILHINKLRDEVNRLGRITAVAPLMVRSTAMGIQLYLADQPAGAASVNWSFAQTIDQINPNGKGQIAFFTVDNGGNWKLDTNPNDYVYAYAPPLLAPGQFYPAGILVGVIYSSQYSRWCVINTSCEGC